MPTFTLQAKHRRITQDLATSIPSSDPGTHTAATDTTKTRTADTTWSPEDLRGVPIIGRNVAGAINGTSPHLRNVR